MRRWMMGVALVGTLWAPAAADAQDADALAKMRAENDRIQLANYPREALRRGEEGVVGISVVTDKQGRLRECQVSKSSGYRSLDAATCDFLFDHVSVKAYVAPNGGGPVQRQEGQVVWKLPPGLRPAAAAAAAPPPKGAGSPVGEKRICRSQAKTGSLIASQRICLTRSEWYQQYLRAQEETQDMKPKFQPGN